MNALHRNLRCSLLIASILATPSVQAIELFRRTDVQSTFGSKAWATFPTLAGDSHFRYMAGAVYNSTGDPLPALWAVFTESYLIEEFALPSMGSATGELVGGAELPTGELIVVGNLRLGGTEMAAVWRRSPSMVWNGPFFPFPNATRSRMARADYCGDGVPHTRAVGFAEVGGMQRPVSLIINLSIGWEAAFLPLPAGAEGQALGVGAENGSTQEDGVAGWYRTGTGPMLPCMWPLDGGVWVFTPVPHPANTFGQMQGYYCTSDSWSGLGRIRSTAEGWAGIGAEANVAGLRTFQPLEGFEHSSANSASLWQSGPTTLGAPFISGTSWNDGGDPRASFWIWTDSRGTPTEDLLAVAERPEEVLEFDASGLQEGMAFGQVLLAQDGWVAHQACTFQPVPVSVPNSSQLFFGKYVDPDGRLSGLWHDDDGEQFGIQLNRAGGRAAVELRYNPVCGVDGVTYASTTVTARAAGNRPGAAGTLSIYIASSGTFFLLGTANLTSANQTFTFTLPEPRSQWADPVTGEVRQRVFFTASNPRTNSVLISSIKIEHEG